MKKKFNLYISTGDLPAFFAMGTANLQSKFNLNQQKKMKNTYTELQKHYEHYRLETIRQEQEQDKIRAELKAGVSEHDARCLISELDRVEKQHLAACAWMHALSRALAIVEQNKGE